MMKHPVLNTIALMGSLLIGASAHSQSINKPADLGATTIVQAFDMVPGKNAEETRKAMQNMVSAIRKMPGLIDDVVLDNKNPNNKPSHVHVMRWKEQKNWESMFASPDFQKVVKDNANYFVIDSTKIFTPVK